MIGLCKECTYWERTSIGVLNFGKCSCNKFVYTGSEWEEVGIYNDGLNYWDSESYLASFETGENFGCVHFKKKD